uniref:Protein-disulfide reductase (Glutathione) n=1 Tax=Tetraselmis sp. GSL018 TaxID=582737 RepID=A0A061R0C4_9CHLO|mmetsp:Transcript_41466/g.98247  ORF Transcript_41466/g.98247 Transcript_41466/m.98247 type:complete len:163 (-) Transcript_41466:292-780(-)
MGTRTTLVLLFASVFSSQVLGGHEDKSNGFNTEIDWHSWEDMKRFDFSTNTKPVLYLFNKPWCGACKRLKQEFNGPKAAKIVELSQQFVMVNVVEDIADKKYAPDGGYIPRILFANPRGVIRPSIKNKSGNPKFNYFYSSAAEVEAALASAAELLSADKTEL